MFPCIPFEVVSFFFLCGSLMVFSKLQQESLSRQQEQQQLAEEQARVSALISEKQELEERLTALSKSGSLTNDKCQQ